QPPGRRRQERLIVVSPGEKKPGRLVGDGPVSVTAEVRLQDQNERHPHDIAVVIRMVMTGATDLMSVISRPSRGRGDLRTTMRPFRRPPPRAAAAESPGRGSAARRSPRATGAG